MKIYAKDAEDLALFACDEYKRFKKNASKKVLKSIEKRRKRGVSSHFYDIVMSLCFNPAFGKPMEESEMQEIVKNRINEQFENEIST